ncbi:transcriptional regulator [Alteromonas sp. KUL156]|nr:transcriptional regulator [Alteromonas sp. KUL154]GFE02509.1 transcriptional regulator [Alteromonas sp. KUL156]
MKKILVLLHVIVLSSKVYSQKHTKKDTLLEKSFEELSALFYASKHDTLKATTYAKKYFSKALKEKDTIRMISGKYYLADILNNEKVYLSFCDSLIEITKKSPTKNFPVNIYISKASFFFNKGKNSKALKELTLGKENLRDNDSLNNVLLIKLALIQSSIGKYNKALNLYRKAHNYALKNDIIDKVPFSTIPLNIALAYKKLDKIDSAFFYNQKAVELYKEINDSLSLGYSFLILGQIEGQRKNYKESVISYKKSIPYVISDENYKILSQIYTLIGAGYDSIYNYNFSLKYHKKADSLYSQKKLLSTKLESSFKFLLQHYKKENNLKKQLEFLNKILKVKEYKVNEKTQINKTFSEEYDIPNLISEKKKIIEKLKHEVNESRKIKIAYIVLVTLLVILIGYQNKRKRTYKKRFLLLVNQEKLSKNQSKETLKNYNKNEISTEIVTNILKQLKSFEKKEKFINPDTSLQSLSDKFETNTSYLSKVINQYKNTSFSNYVNELRIEYTVEKLKKDTLWRKYTIKAIAAEVGFKSPEAFSKAFYKFTGIKPSYFIKELEKSEKD